jgi:anti-sigma factor RsiW
MVCKQFETWIFDYVDNRLGPPARAEMEAHLAGCATCRVAWNQVNRLDEELASRLSVLPLPIDFAAKLEARLASEATDERDRLETERRFQREFEECLLGLRRAALDWPLLAATSGAALLIGVVGGLIWLFTPHVLAALAGPGLPIALQRLAFVVLASVVFVLVGLSAAFPRPFQRLLCLISD